MLGIMRRNSQEQRRPDPLVDGLIGFLWTFTASLLLIAGVVFAALGIGTHLLIRLRPSVTKVITYDPSTVAVWSFVPITAGVVLWALYLRRLRRRRITSGRCC